MHIAFLNSIEKEIYGGMEEWIRLAAIGLAKRGHTITLIGRQDSYYLKRAGELHENINLLELAIGGDFSPATISKIKNYLNDKSVDVLTVNFNKDVRLGGLAARWNKKTKVVWSVGLNITKDTLIHKVLTPKLVDKVIVPSESLKKEITALGYIEETITEVIPIAIEDITVPFDREVVRNKIITKYNIDASSCIAVTSGRFVDQKGHKYLIKAASQIVKKIPQIKFLFLGDGPLRNELQTDIKKNNLGEYFIFAGMLDDINDELFSADIMIHPSVFEPFGIAILEGMRAGLPIVASRIGGIPEVVQEGYNAKLVEIENHDQLADTVIDLLTNRDILKKFGEQSRTRFETVFQMSTMVDKIEKCYQSFLTDKVIRG